MEQCLLRTIALLALTLLALAACAHSETNACSNAHPCSHDNGNTDAYPDAYGDRIANGISHCDPNAQPSCNGYSYAYA